MKRVETQSGAVYLLDEENKRFKRLTGPEIDDQRVEDPSWPDGQWIYLHSVPEVLTGYPMWFVGAGGQGQRRTTRVRLVEEADDA